MTIVYSLRQAIDKPLAGETKKRYGRDIGTIVPSQLRRSTVAIRVSSHPSRQQDTYRFNIHLQIPEVTVHPIPRQGYLAFTWKKHFDLGTRSPTVYFTFTVWDKVIGQNNCRYQTESGRSEGSFPCLFSDLIKAPSQDDAYYEGVRRFWESTFSAVACLRPKANRVMAVTYWQWTLFGASGLPAGFKVTADPVDLGPYPEHAVPLPAPRPNIRRRR